MIIKNQMLTEEEFVMSVLPKDLIRDFIKDQHLTSTDSILDLLKEMFKDVLQEACQTHETF
jgi:hypothetical protein